MLHNKTATTLAGMALIVCAFVNLYWGLSFYNADTLFLPSLYKDLFENGGSWFFWTFPQAGFFFPDMPLYGILKLFFPHDYLIPLFLQMCLQLVCLSVFVYWFFKRFFGGSHLLLLTGIAVGLYTSPVFNLTGVIQGSLWPTHHGGGFLMMLLSIMALFRVYDAGKGLGLLFLLAFLGGFSDPLYLLDFSIPALIFFLYQKGALSQKARGVIMLLFSLGGLWIAQLLSPFTLGHADFTKVTQLQTCSQTLASLLSQLTDVSTYKPLALISILAALIVLVCQLRQAKEQWKSWLFFVLGTLLPLAAVVVTGYYHQTFEWRYFPQLVLFSLLFVLGRLATWKHGVLVYGALVIAAACPVLWGMAESAMPAHHQSFEVAAYHKLYGDSPVQSAFPDWRDLEYPIEVAMLDHLKEQYHLHDGLAFDWLCRPVSVLSRRGLRLHQINGDGNVRLLLNSAQEYGVQGISQQPGNHDFIVSYMLNEGAILQRFGQPSQIVAGRLFLSHKPVKIFIYAPGVIDNVLSKDQLLWATVLIRLTKNPYL